MQINQNIPALNAWMAVNNTNNQMQQTIEQLSTGYKINSAADNPASYAIIQKMEGQVNGLNTAMSNAQNGISLIQTATGALSQDQAILQSMNQLAVQASNDTNTTSDRQQIQQEMNQLVSQIDQIRNTTQFNTQVLLNGNLNYTGASGTATLVNPSANLTSASIAKGTVEANTTLTINTITTGTASAPNAVQVYYNGNLLNASASSTTGAYVSITQPSGSTSGSYILTVNVSSGGKYTAEINVNLAGMSSTGTPKVYTNASTAAYSVVNTGAVRLDEATGNAPGDNNSLTFQIGANQAQTVSLGLNDMGAQALGLESTSPINTAQDPQASTNTYLGNGYYSTIDVTTQAGAEAAISMISNANQVVSTEASKLGALQDRITDITNNLQTSSTNMTSSQGTIQDADMALEMTQYSKEQILLQSSMAMLGQANTNPQQVLTLFRALP
jgi:flagellin